MACDTENVLIEQKNNANANFEATFYIAPRKI